MSLCRRLARARVEPRTIVVDDIRASADWSRVDIDGRLLVYIVNTGLLPLPPLAGVMGATELIEGGARERVLVEWGERFEIARVLGPAEEALVELHFRFDGIPVAEYVDTFYNTWARNGKTIVRVKYLLQPRAAARHGVSPERCGTTGTVEAEVAIQAGEWPLPPRPGPVPVPPKPPGNNVQPTLTGAATAGARAGVTRTIKKRARKTWIY